MLTQNTTGLPQVTENMMRALPKTQLEHFADFFDIMKEHSDGMKTDRDLVIFLNGLTHEELVVFANIIKSLDASA